MIRFSDCSAWAADTVMPCCRASCSLIWNRISQLRVCWVICCCDRLTTPGYLAAPVDRLPASVSRVASVIRLLPTMAAAPILTGEQPVTANPATSASTPTPSSFLTTASSLLARSQYRPYYLAAPSQQRGIPERLSANCGRFRYRSAHRSDGRLEDGLRVQPLDPNLPRVGQVGHRREARMIALKREVGQPGRPGSHPQPGDFQQVEHGVRRCAIPVGELLEHGRDVRLGVDRRDPGVGLE